MRCKQAAVSIKMATKKNSNDGKNVESGQRHEGINKFCHIAYCSTHTHPSVSNESSPRPDRGDAIVAVARRVHPIHTVECLPRVVAPRVDPVVATDTPKHLAVSSRVGPARGARLVVVA